MGGLRTIPRVARTGGCGDSPKRHCQSKIYTASSRIKTDWSSTVFAHELTTRSAGFDAENRLYLFALTMPAR